MRKTKTDLDYYIPHLYIDILLYQPLIILEDQITGFDLNWVSLSVLKIYLW